MNEIEHYMAKAATARKDADATAAALADERALTEFLRLCLDGMDGALQNEIALADDLGRALAELIAWKPATASERRWWIATAKATLARYNAAREVTDE